MGVMPAIFGLIVVWAFLAAVGLVYAEASAAGMNTSGLGFRDEHFGIMHSGLSGSRLRRFFPPMLLFVTA